MGTELINYEEKWAEAATEAAADERVSSGAFVSLRGGVLRVGEDEMPGNQMCVIVLDSVRENAYYESKFDPSAMLPPVCFAFGRGSDADMFPHEGMASAMEYFKPQHVVDGAVRGCQGCPQNEFGSADTGRGKACGNRRRLALLPAGYYSRSKKSRGAYDLELFDDPEHYRAADMAFLKIPVTSVKEWAIYVNQIARDLRRPPYAVVTRISVEPDPKTQFKVRFEMVEEVPVEWAPVLIARHEEAKSALVQPYAPPTAEQLEGRGQAKGRFRR